MNFTNLAVPQEDDEARRPTLDPASTSGRVVGPIVTHVTSESSALGSSSGDVASPSSNPRNPYEQTSSFITEGTAHTQSKAEDEGVGIRPHQQEERAFSGDVEEGEEEEEEEEEEEKAEEKAETSTPEQVTPTRKKKKVQLAAEKVDMEDAEKKMLQAIFDQADADHNHKLSLKELQDAMKHMGFAMDEGDFQMLITELGLSAAEEAGGASFFTMPELFTEASVDVEVEVDFAAFLRVIKLWQEAAHFRVFEPRTAESEMHIRRSRKTKHFLPDTYPRWVWDVIVIMTIFYLWVSSLALHVNTNDEQVLHTLAFLTPFDVVATVVLFTDMVLQFFTCWVEHKHDGRTVVIDDRKTIANRYLTSWFVNDLIAAIPLRLFFFFGGSTDFDLSAARNSTDISGITQSGATFKGSPSTVSTVLEIVVWLNLLKMLKYFSLTRLFVVSQRVSMSKTYVLLFYVLAQGLVVLLRFMMLVHLCAIVYVSLPTDGGDVSLSLQQQLDKTYASGLYLVLYFFSTVGYGDLEPPNDLTRIYYMFLMILGMIINGIVIGNLVQFFNRSDINLQRQETLLELAAVLEYFDVPTALKNEILQFQNHLSLNDLMSTHAGTVRNLPTEMQRNLELFVRVRAISAVPFFREIHNSAKISLCQQLVPIIYCPDEWIVIFGDFGEEMFFINYGFVDVLSKEEVYIVTLKAGDYFGEMALLSTEPVKRMASIRSLTYCDLFVLRKEGFLDVLTHYPRFRKKIEEVVEMRRQATLKKDEEEKLAKTLLMGDGNAPGIQVIHDSDPDDGNELDTSSPSVVPEDTPAAPFEKKQSLPSMVKLKMEASPQAVFEFPAMRSTSLSMSSSFASDQAVGGVTITVDGKAPRGIAATAAAAAFPTHSGPLGESDDIKKVESVSTPKTTDLFSTPADDQPLPVDDHDDFDLEDDRRKSSKLDLVGDTKGTNPMALPQFTTAMVVSTENTTASHPSTAAIPRPQVSLSGSTNERDNASSFRHAPPHALGMAKRSFVSLSGGPGGQKSLDMLRDPQERWRLELQEELEAAPPNFILHLLTRLWSSAEETREMLDSISAAGETIVVPRRVSMQSLSFCFSNRQDTLIGVPPGLGSFAGAGSFVAGPQRGSIPVGLGSLGGSPLLPHTRHSGVAEPPTPFINVQNSMPPRVTLPRGSLGFQGPPMAPTPGKEKARKVTFHDAPLEDGNN